MSNETPEKAAPEATEAAKATEATKTTEAKAEKPARRTRRAKSDAGDESPRKTRTARKTKADKAEDSKAETSEKSAAGRQAPSAYFTSDKPNLNFIPSGSTTLDEVLSGGWAIGRIANIVGDRSAGKCVRNALIMSPELGMVYLDDLCADLPYGQHPYALPVTTTSSTEDRATHLHKEQVSLTYKVRTRHGYEVEGTGKHKLRVLTPTGELIMRRMDELQEGDVLSVVRGTEVYASAYYAHGIDADEFVGDAHIPNEIGVPCIGHPCYLPPVVDESLAEFIGYFVADGNFMTGSANNVQSLMISNSRSFILDRIETLLDEWGLGLTADKRYVTNARFARFLFELLGRPDSYTGRTKYVPSCILRSPKSVQTAFLRALLDCDGYADGSKHLEYYTASERLGREVQLMLLNMGIITSRRFTEGAKVGETFYDHTYYRVAINGIDLCKYAETVGSLKYGECFGLREGLTHKSRKSGYDSLPHVLPLMRQHIEELRQRVGWCRNGKMSEREGRFPRFLTNQHSEASWPLLDKFIEAFEPFEDVLSLEAFRQLRGHGYHFDPITVVDECRETVDVFDFHVPDTHLFWANGFVNHNTLLAIEAVANFSLLYPGEPIYYLEAEAAFDQEYAALGMPVEAVEFVEMFDDEGNADNTVEFLFEHLQELIKARTSGAMKYDKCLYVIDSLDALSDRAEKERDNDQGSYGMGKQKKMSEMFRRIVAELEKAGITLLVISQIREKIGVTFGEKYTRSGGKALDFYCSQIVWLADVGKLKRTVRKQERVTGVKVKAKCKKNKVGLPFRECDYQIEFGYGIDDLTSCLEFLKGVDALDEIESVTVSKAQMGTSIRKIKNMDDDDYDDAMAEIKGLVRKYWREIDQSFMPVRTKYRLPKAG